MTTAATALVTGRIILNKINSQITSNNLANATTPGFEARRMITHEYEAKPVPGESISFSKQDGMMRDRTPGGTKNTGNPLDLALNNRGAYFAVETPEGQVFYTLDGTFILNNDRQITDVNGNFLLDRNLTPITLPPGHANPSVGEDGIISVADLEVAQLGGFTFENLDALRNQGRNLLGTDQEPIPIERLSITQHAYRESNVNPIIEVTNLVEILNDHKLNERVIEVDYQLQEKARDEIMHTFS